MSLIKRVAGLVLAAAVFVAGGRAYLGNRHYETNKETRAGARSVESAFATLKAELAAAVRWQKNPAFYQEAGRLHLERAQAENEFGSAEKRDAFAVEARDFLAEAIRRSPAESSAYFDMGKVYLLANYPLLTYAEKSRLFFRKAVELKPADEFINQNVVFVFLSQEEMLTPDERAFALDRLRAVAAMRPSVLARLRTLWKKEYGNEEGLAAFARAAGIELPAPAVRKKLPAPSSIPGN